MADRSSLPRRSPLLLRGFLRYARWLVARNFHAVRVLRGSEPDREERGDRGPVVVVLNHPSWWDPLLAVVAAEHYFAGREHWGPIDAAALAKYRVLGRVGFFGVEQHTRRGAAQFLRGAEAALAGAGGVGGVVGVTAQGAFTDVRERPVRLMPGVATLMQRYARRGERLVVLPLAVEIAFWNERYPEALLAWGEAVEVGTSRAGDAGAGGVAAWNAVLAQRLEAAMDRLAAGAMSRNADRFDTIHGGSVGVGGVYDAARRARAWLGGGRFEAGHGE